MILRTAVLVGLVSSQSFAAFTFSVSFAPLPTNPALERINLLATADTATISIGSLSLTMDAYSPNALKFFAPAVGNPQIYPASDDASYTNAPGYTPAGGSAGNRLTYGGLAFDSTTLADLAPSPTNKSLFEAGLRRIQYISTFSSPFTAATADIGKLILGSAVVPAGVGLTFSGTIQSDLNNPATPQNFAVVVESGPTPPVITAPAPTTVDFGPGSGADKIFSVTVHVTDANAASVLSLSVGTLPAGISSIAVSEPGQSPRDFLITGNVSSSLLNTTTIIPFSVTDGLGQSAASSFTLVITPEPATLLSVSGVAIPALMRRRMKVLHERPALLA